MSSTINLDAQNPNIQGDGSNYELISNQSIKTKLDGVFDEFSRNYGETFKTSRNEDASINIIATQITVSFLQEEDYKYNLHYDNTYNAIVKYCKKNGVVKQLIDKRSALEANPQVTQGLLILGKVAPNLATSENREELIQSGENAKSVAWGLKILHEANPALITQENFKALIQSGENAESVAKGLVRLRAVNPDFVTPENRDALIQSGANAESVAAGLVCLHAANPDLVTPENRNALIQSGANAKWVARGLQISREMNALITQELFNEVIASTSE